MKARPSVATLAALTLAGAGIAVSATASATGAKAEPKIHTVAKGLVGPLSVAQAPDGTRYWADSFAGPLYKQSPGGEPTVVFAGTKKFTAEGVSADEGVLRFSTSYNNKVAHIYTLDPETGDPVEIADTFAYEKKADPDGAFHYGFINTPQSCLDKLPKGIPATYKPAKESHPYATAYAAGTTYVADAGANAVLAIDPVGTVSTVAALKPVKVKITKSGAEANKMPKCTIGKKYAFEAVPTDIEVGPDGRLYVSSLPGGPEDGSLGANGRVLKVDPVSGKVRTVAGGLVSATGVAVAENGDIYVTQLFAGLISRIKAGSDKVKPYVQVPLPAAVEATPTGLLATINALPGKKPHGKVVTITP